MEAMMAQRVSVELEDDLDGGPADETLRFGIGGSEYETDLSKKNASKFRRQIAPYIEHARKAGRGQRRRPARTASSREHNHAHTPPASSGIVQTECREPPTTRPGSSGGCSSPPVPHRRGAAAGGWLGSKTGSKRVAISGHHERHGATGAAGRTTSSHIQRLA